MGVIDEHVGAAWPAGAQRAGQQDRVGHRTCSCSSVFDVRELLKLANSRSIVWRRWSALRSRCNTAPTLSIICFTFTSMEI